MVDQIYSDIPGINDLISHTLTYDHLEFSDETNQVYKDLALLAHNRTSNFSDQKMDTDCEQMVIDYKNSEDTVDANHVTYFQSKEYDGHLGYQNLIYVN